MKKKLIIIGVILLVCGMITAIIVIETNRIHFEKVKEVTKAIVKEDYNIEVDLEKYEKMKDKTGNVTYRLYFSPIEGMEINGELSCHDINQITMEESISLNIGDIALAKKVQEKYGDGYEIVKLHFYIASEWYPLPYYRFLLKNKGAGYPYLEGKIPVNRKIEEIFEENENSTWS